MTAAPRLAAIVFTDVVGYSALMGRDERGTLAQVQADFNTLRMRCTEHGGEVLNTMGDGMLLAFPSAIQAVTFALDAQAAFLARHAIQASPPPLMHRIGVHLGDVYRLADGSVAGDGVNIASRLESRAPPGGLCVSQGVYDLARGRVPMQSRFLGLEPLKNIGEPVAAWVVLPEAAPASLLGPEAATPSDEVAPAPGPRTPMVEPPNSIAVLPFVNMSADPENEYFSDGLSEELLNVLVKVTSLRVIARTSSFAFKGKSVTVGEIARQLAVGHVLEGSVRKAGNRVRVTAQLIRASDDAHLWSETYDRMLDDIFAVQDDISRDVVEALKLKLAGPAPSVCAAGGTTHATAFEAYLRGKHIFDFNDGSKASHERALAAFDEAISLDPGYARAHLGRAMVFLQLGHGHALIDAQEAERHMRSALDRALALAPDLAEALAFRAMFATFLAGQGVAAARSDLDRALASSPESAYVKRRVAEFELACGNTEAALTAARSSLETDPLNPSAAQKLADVLLFSGRYAEGEAVLRGAIAKSAGAVSNLGFSLGNLLLAQGRAEEALAAFDQEPSEGLRQSGRARAVARLQDPGVARRELEGLRQRFGDAGTYHYAVILALLNDRDGAFEMLERARGLHDMALLLFLRCDPMLDSLRDDPRYGRLVEDLGLTCT